MRFTPNQEGLRSPRFRLGLGLGALTLGLLGADVSPKPIPEGCHVSVHYPIVGEDIEALLNNDPSAWQRVKQDLEGSSGHPSTHEVSVEMGYMDDSRATAQSQSETLTKIASQRLGYPEGSHPQAYRALMDQIGVVNLYPNC